MGDLRVEVSRGDRVESAHQVSAAVVGPGGVEAFLAGAVEEPVFTRSAIKPFQAMPLVEDGVAEAYGLTEQELAVCCASHGGEPRHVEMAASILRRAGLGEEALACGPHDPLHGPTARALREKGSEPGRLHNNCSGKHAGMLALARFHGWPVRGYHEGGHPVQERVADTLGRWMDLDPGAIPRGVDGCGVVTFAVPVRSLALGFGRLAAAAGDTRSAAGQVLGAMGRHPFMVGGTGRLCTELAGITDGRVVAKVGAEGVYAGAIREPYLGLALKVRDGARRAAEVALLGLLAHLDLLRPEELDALAERVRPVVRNTRGESVGRIRPVVEGRRHG